MADLRTAAKQWGINMPENYVPTMDDAIAALRDALAQAERLFKLCDDQDSVIRRQRAERLKLEAERDALVTALEIAVRQNEHDMVMTGEELRQCRDAIDMARKGGGNG